MGFLPWREFVPRLLVLYGTLHGNNMQSENLALERFIRTLHRSNWSKSHACPEIQALGSPKSEPTTATLESADRRPPGNRRAAPRTHCPHGGAAFPQEGLRQRLN